MGDFYGVHRGGPDLSYVTSSLYRLFKAQGALPNPAAFDSDVHPVPLRPVALIFGRPSSKIFQDEFLVDRSYYNLRSGENVEFFYMGYDPSAQRSDPSEPSLFDENDFSDACFVSAVEDVERRTRWTYSGGTDLILLNACIAPPKHDRVVYIPDVYLDFSAALSLNLEKAVDSKLVPSARCLVESIMRHSRECATRDVVLKISNEVVLKNAGRSLFSWFAGLLKIKAEDIGNVLAAGLTDISKGPDKPTLLSLNIEDPTAGRSI